MHEFAKRGQDGPREKRFRELHLFLHEKAVDEFAEPFPRRMKFLKHVSFSGRAEPEPRRTRSGATAPSRDSTSAKSSGGARDAATTIDLDLDYSTRVSTFARSNVWALFHASSVPIGNQNVDRTT